MVWHTLNVNPKELVLETTLGCGQSFGWIVTGDQEWSCVLEGHLISLKQTPLDVLFQLRTQHSDETTVRSLLRSYFQLDMCLEDLFRIWCDSDKHFARIAAKFHGLRLLRQDPVENLFSFICSSNNHIARITTMVQRMSRRFGHKIGTVNGVEFYSFPSIHDLAVEGVDLELLNLGFGYRAKFIHRSAMYLQARGIEWLYNLRQQSYEDAHKSLQELPGIGMKVADCICLMSLDKLSTIPVDTHIWQIALRDYGLKRQGFRSLTPKVYAIIRDRFQSIFGPFAGWAHTVRLRMLTLISLSLQFDYLMFLFFNDLLLDTLRGRFEVISEDIDSSHL